MSYTLSSYIIYLIVSLIFTVWVARSLFSNGRVFLVESFGTEKMADSVNHLLLVGFYLINIGFVALFLRSGTKPGDVVASLEYVVTKLGIVLLVLGAMHFFNMWNISKIHSKANRKKVPPLPGGERP